LMTIRSFRVEKHPRGMAISTPEGADRDSTLSALADRLAEQGYISGGRLIAGTEAAADVLVALGEDSVAWDYDILQYAHQQLKGREMQLRARLEVATALEDPHSVLRDYSRIAKLDPHQVDAVAAIVAPSLRGIGLFDEQGTGKTVIALAAFDVLRERGCVRKLLVVAPKSVLGSWQDQVESFLGKQLRVLLVAGPAAQRRRAILRPHDILLVGYEGAVHDERLLKTILAARPFSYLLVVDESYFIKNPETARSSAVSRLRSLCERAVVLCGTPAPNTAVDLVNQINLADAGVAFGGRVISKERDAAISEVMEGLQNAIFLRRLKTDVLPELQPKQVVKVYLRLPRAQRALYERTRSELVIAVRGVDDREFRRRLSSFLAKRLRLLQICSNPRALDPLYDEEPAKLMALDRLLRELIDQQAKKVVIWSYFRASLEAIAERYSKYGLVRIDGSVTSISARISAIERFQNDSAVRVFVGNAAAAGVGITLTAAHHAIYESFSNQAAHYMQSVDRIHRRGQTEQVTSHVLIAKQTVEEAEYDRLVQKERVGRALLGDEFEEPMSRERFLTDLEGGD
jgi:SNF2 family DNA or RNA helicase